MDNIKEFKVNGTAYGLNLSEIGAVINDGGTQKELKQYIDSHSGGGGGTSSKIVRIGNDWYIGNDRYQTEIKNALDDIYNEISKPSLWAVIVDTIKIDIHFPLYNSLLYLWSKIFSNSDVALKFLSVVFSMATVVVSFFIGKNIKNSFLEDL